MIIYLMSKVLSFTFILSENINMTERESESFNNELTRNAVEIRQIVQDFPLCSTFKEIDEQNALGN